jgi:hypothetical protein
MVLMFSISKKLFLGLLTLQSSKLECFLNFDRAGQDLDLVLFSFLWLVILQSSKLEFVKILCKVCQGWGANLESLNGFTVTKSAK